MLLFRRDSNHGQSFLQTLQEIREHLLGIPPTTSVPRIPLLLPGHHDLHEVDHVFRRI